MKIKIFLRVGVIILLCSYTCSNSMEKSFAREIASSSKKRKLRRQRALQAMQHKNYLEKKVLEHLYNSSKKNEPTFVPIESWFPLETYFLVSQSEPIEEEQDTMNQEVQGDLPYYYTFFGDYIIWKDFLEDAF